MKTNQKKLIIAVILSLVLIHVPLFFALWQLDLLSPRDVSVATNPSKEQVVMVKLNESTPQNIVDTTPPSVQKVPQKATAQSLYNSSVKEETVAASPTPVVSKPQSTTASQQQLSQDKTQSPLRQTAPIDFKSEFSKILNEEKNKEEKKYADRFEHGSNKNSVLFKTNLNSTAASLGGDFLPDYKVGNRTYLNTLANPHVGYYVELKRKFRTAFNPYSALRYRLQEVSRGQISVVWGISVDESGNVNGLTLLRPSGINEYDAEARRTISSSAPFNKPPLLLLGKDHQLHMAWTFVVYL